MRDDLLGLIGKEKEVVNAIVLTHDIDFVFLQAVALSVFRRCGSPSLTIFADADCAARLFAIQRGVLDGLGSRYRVIPVKMSGGLAFHPKAVLLSGFKSASLYVGSGNLTFGGWRENAEVWSHYQSPTDGVTVFREFEAYLGKVMQIISLPDTVRAEVADAFDGNTKKWITDSPAGESALLGRVAVGEVPLLEPLLEALKPASGDALYVCAPYFDAEAEALQKFCEVPAAARHLFHPVSGSTLTASGWASVANRMSRTPSSVFHENADGAKRSAFIHAKFYAVVKGDEAVIVQGSANCSRAALTLGGKQGNAELMSIVRTSAAEFQQSWLALLQAAEEMPPLPEAAQEEEETPLPQVRVLAAHFEDGVIAAAFYPSDGTLIACRVDGVQSECSQATAGLAKVPFRGNPRTLELAVRVGDLLVWSSPHWIDHEHLLRATATGRRLEDSIRRQATEERWGCGAWIELVQVLGQHLTYSAAPQAFVADRPALANKGEPQRYEALFNLNYAVGPLGVAIPPLDTGELRHVSIRNLLLHWFRGEPDDEIAPEGADDPAEDGDRQERPPPNRGLRVATPPTLGEQVRLRQVLMEVTDVVTSKGYCQFRSPELLATDIKIFSLLLRIGFREGWVVAEEFFSITHSIWSVFFLTSGVDERAGWLEVRHRYATDPEAFQNALGGPQVSAALIAWALAGMAAPDSPQKARFLLARVIAVARLPWLWFGGDPACIAKEIKKLIEASEANLETVDATAWAQEWHTLLAQGMAFRKIEQALSSIEPAQVRVQLGAGNVLRGDLLWQGPAGFCVALTNGERVSSERIDTLKLQSGGGTGTFMGDFIMPMRSLVEIVHVSQALNSDDKGRIEAVMRAISVSAMSRP